MYYLMIFLTNALSRGFQILFAFSLFALLVFSIYYLAIGMSSLFKDVFNVGNKDNSSKFKDSSKSDFNDTFRNNSTIERSWCPIIDIGFSEDGYNALILVNRNSKSLIRTIKIAGESGSYAFPQITKIEDFLNMEVFTGFSGEILDIRYIKSDEDNN